MQSILESYKPKEVLKFFEIISKIPRGSENEKGISDYLVRFAKERNLKYIQDEKLNVCIFKNATKGYENKPSVILQGHMDMVCEKNKNVEHDFLKDPIKLKIDGDFILAEGTTLGADNGIAIAMCLAILDSDEIEHPALEILMTSEEEIGLMGAKAFDASVLKSKLMINLDTETEGVFISGCAGGFKYTITIDGKKIILNDNYECYEINVLGLKGGHSGADIHKQRGNSNIILGRILNHFRNMDVYISDIEGGIKENVIPREASLKIFVNKNDIKTFKLEFNEITKIIKNELKYVDKNLVIELNNFNDKSNKQVFSKEGYFKLACLLNLLPNGVIYMSKKIDNLVETSNNIGVTSINEDKILVKGFLRSNVFSKQIEILDKIKLLCESLDTTIKTYGEYPEWEFNPNSKLRDSFVKTYERVFKKEPKVDAIHAGLECGLFTEKIKDIDIIAIGPNIYNAHNPDEKLSIPSLEKCYKLLINGLKDL